jgi:hypothetical protein
LFDGVSALAPSEKKPPELFAVWNQTTPTGQQKVPAAFFRGPPSVAHEVCSSSV